MMIAYDAELALALGRQRGEELRAEVERYRLAREIRNGRAARGGEAAGNGGAARGEEAAGDGRVKRGGSGAGDEYVATGAAGAGNGGVARGAEAADRGGGAGRTWRRWRWRWRWWSSPGRHRPYEQGTVVVGDGRAC